MGERWDRRRAVAIALGGVAGATVRWAATVTVVPSGDMPWTVLAINVLGSVLLGALLAEEWGHPSARLVLHSAGAIGFCGGLTTFSTFTLEVVNLVRDGNATLAATYGVLSVALSVAGVLGGAAALRRVRAIALPLEEEP
ncbi:MAG: fluoride efflux transporter FluC [Microthrixaceae bacterium]